MGHDALAALNVPFLFGFTGVAQTCGGLDYILICAYPTGSQLILASKVMGKAEQLSGMKEIIFSPFLVNVFSTDRHLQHTSVWNMGEFDCGMLLTN